MNDKWLDKIKNKFSNSSNLANIELATILYEQIKDYPMLHSTPYIIKPIVEAIKKDVPNIGAYLEARMIPYTSRQLSNTQR